MTTRSDVDVDFNPSPRIATVQQPATEFLVQDIVDTLRIKEESWRGQTESKLLNASGKENLGGGVKVGVTVALQDTQIAFESRTTPAEVGTVTTGSGPATNNFLDLYDTSATFQSNNISRGSLVINFTDHSIAEVYSVEAENHLKTRALVNGTNNVFNINDNYQVFNVVQCKVTGGNIVAVDDIGLELPPILPTAFTQIVKTSSSSATLQEQASIQHSSFNDGVTVDVINGVAGTEFPIGTSLQPVNNMADAHIIGMARGFHNFYIRGDITMSAYNHDGHIFIGESPSLTTITLEAGTNVINSEFQSATIVGTLDGNCTLKECNVGNITYISGFIHECALEGNIVLGGGAIASFVHCWSNIAGGIGTPTIDMGGTGNILIIRGYDGGIKIANCTTANNTSFDINSGRVIIDSTVTAGDFYIRGIADVTDNSTGTAAVYDQTVKGQNDSVLNLMAELLKYNKNRTKIDPIAYTLTVYDDDKVTPLEVFDLKDENGLQTITSIFERIPQSGSP